LKRIQQFVVGALLHRHIPSFQDMRVEKNEDQNLSWWSFQDMRVEMNERNE
jgi:hypothetical protein